VTGLARNEATTDEQLAVVTRLFDLVGATLSVPERMIDSVSSISGSGRLL